MTATHTRSATFNPADYRIVAVEDLHDDDGFLDIMDDDLADRAGMGRNGGDVPTDAFVAEMEAVDYRCAHCGRRSNMRFVAFVRHVPTGDLLMFGHHCMADAGLPDATAYARKRAGETAAARKRAAEVAAARAAWEDANPEQAAALDIYDAEWDRDDPTTFDPFLADLVSARNRYGALTEAQTPWPTTAMVHRIERMERDAAKAAAMADVPPLATGRIDITGTIASVKSEPGYTGRPYDIVLKCLVVMDDGNRVWGTVPRAIENAATDPDTDTSDGVRGWRVAFSGDVTPSNDDPHFGFYKRPTKVRIIDTAPNGAGKE